MKNQNETASELAYLLKSNTSSVAQDRETLISYIEWLVRDLTREAEALKAEPDRTPSTSLLTGSLPHSIEELATRISAKLDAMCELRTVIKFADRAAAEAVEADAARANEAVRQ